MQQRYRQLLYLHTNSQKYPRTKHLARTGSGSATPGACSPVTGTDCGPRGGVVHFLPWDRRRDRFVPVCQTPKTALKSASREFARPTSPGWRRRLPIRVKRRRMACWRIGPSLSNRVSSLPNLSQEAARSVRHRHLPDLVDLTGRAICGVFMWKSAPGGSKQRGRRFPVSCWLLGPGRSICRCEVGRFSLDSRVSDPPVRTAYLVALSVYCNLARPAPVPSWPVRPRWRSGVPSLVRLSAQRRVPLSVRSG